MDGPVSSPGRLWGQRVSRGGPPGLPLAGDSALMADTVCGGDGVAEEAGCSARLLSGALAAGAGKV